MTKKADSYEPFKNIALGGRSGSGKTIIAKYLVSRYGYTHCSTGQIVRHVCQLLFESESKSIMNRVSDAMRAIDENLWVKAALKEQSQPIVFDSVRSESEYFYLKERGFRIWRVESPVHMRINRLQLRGQEFDQVKDDQHVTEISIDDVPVDYQIINSGESLSALYLKVDEAMLAS